jgi:hypothetical protein
MQVYGIDSIVSLFILTAPLNLKVTCIFYISQNTLRSVGHLVFVVIGFEFSFAFNIY